MSHTLGGTNQVGSVGTSNNIDPSLTLNRPCKRTGQSLCPQSQIAGRYAEIMAGDKLALFEHWWGHVPRSPPGNFAPVFENVSGVRPAHLSSRGMIIH